MMSLCKISPKCMIILKKCILALYCAIFWFASFNFLKVHTIIYYEHITGAHESFNRFDTHPEEFLFDWLFIIATFAVMTLAPIGLCFNWVLAPISLAVHVFATSNLALLIELSDQFRTNVVPDKMRILYAFGLYFSFFGFFETVAVWLSYDLYKMKLKKNSIKKATEDDDAQIVYHKMVDDDDVVL